MMKILTAKSSLYFETYGCVNTAVIAVGPIVTSFVLPKIRYTKLPIKLLYSPYCKENVTFHSDIITVPFKHSVYIFLTIHYLKIYENYRNYRLVVGNKV